MSIAMMEPIISRRNQLFSERRCAALSLALSTLLLASVASPAPTALPLPAIVPVETRSTRTLAPGIEMTTVTRSGTALPLQMWVITVDPHAGSDQLQWKLRIATGGPSVLGFAPVSQIAARENALLAVNGGYFAFGGAALGALKIDNEWLRLPLKNRTALGIDEKGGVLIAPLQTSARLQWADGSIELNNFNGYAPENGVTLLTPRFASSYKIRGDESAWEGAGQLVTRRLESGLAQLTPGSWCVTARGAARDALNAWQVGTVVRVMMEPEPAVWREYSTILGGGPRLLKNGEIFTTEKTEEFRPDVLARGPRTAFGVDEKGRWIFLVTDGRAPEYSMGLTLPELARELQLAGAREAICLDGGGSSTLVAGGELLNRPSDGAERRVPNALVVVPAAVGLTTR